MRSLKFVLSALAILLAGAIAAGLAARAVAAPKTGELISAGVVPIPSVLGQTADEALFYPWSLYDMEELTPVTEEALIYLEGMWYAAAGFDLFGVDFDGEKLARSQMWTGDGDSLQRGGYLVYLKDFPAMLSGREIPVSLDYAMSGSSTVAVSYLVRPQEEAELTEEQRQAAMDKVKNDLAWMLWQMLESDTNYRNDLAALLESFSARFHETDLLFGFEHLEWLAAMLYGQYGGSLERQVGDTLEPGEGLELSGPPPLSLEELLDVGGGAVDVQFVAAPRQVVLLFSANGLKVGVYYDVQLEQYSGLGISM